MTDKKRFEVQVYLPDICDCNAEMLMTSVTCHGDDKSPKLVYLTLSTPSIAEARKFAYSHFPEAVKISVREL